MSGVGLLTSVVLAYFGILYASDLVALVQRGGHLSLLNAWVRIGAVVCLVIGGAYLSWVWMRTLRRLPAFLARWLRDDSSPYPPVNRPFLFVAPGLSAFTVGLWGVWVDSDELILAAWWPVALLVVLLATYITRHRVPSPTLANEDHLILIGLCAEMLVLLVADASLFEDGPSLWRLVFDELSSRRFVLLSVGVLGIAYIEDAIRYAEEQSGYGRFASAVYLLSWGGAVFLALFATGTAGHEFVLGLLLVASGLLVGVTEYYHL
jgi:hypothetical protein